MDRFINHMIDELDDVERNPYLDREEKERARIRVVNAIINNKQNELTKIMNSVASKYIKWSLYFIQERLYRTRQVYLSRYW